MDRYVKCRNICGNHMNNRIKYFPIDNASKNCYRIEYLPRIVFIVFQEVVRNLILFAQNGFRWNIGLFILNAQNINKCPIVIVWYILRHLCI